jgi:Zn-finger nucleic acid-binding protein
MDSWKHCPRCNVETELGCGYNKCPSCGGIWNKSDLQGMFRTRNDAKRLAAVRAVTKIAVDPMARLHDIEKTVQALAAVWPEAVDADETSQALRAAGYGG